VGVVERETQVRSCVEKVWNGRDYDAAADLDSENYVNAFGTGPSARVEPIRRYHHAFPDLHLDVEELIVAGDTVVLKGISRNRHRRASGTASDRAGSRGLAC
jgi:predicted ester cyclase